MNREVAKIVRRIFIVAAFVVIVLFSESAVSSGGVSWLRPITQEVRAVCRDPGTQWMVFVCCAIYFVTFTLLGKRGTRSAERGTSLNHQRSALNLIFSPDLCLCALLLIASLHYALNYATASGSTQALMLIVGAAIGKGVSLWIYWNAERGTRSAEQESKPETWNLKLETLLLVVLVLLAVAALWQPEAAMRFQYRGLERWSGPWNNPNLFGLLMGVGVVLAAGLLAVRFGLRVSGCGFPKPGSPPRRGQGWADLLWYAFLLGCMSCCSVGLLKSYSRGAWLGAALGLTMLMLRAVGQTILSAGSPDFPVRRSKQATVKSPTPEDKNVHPASLRGTLSCIPWCSWLAKNYRPLSIILFSLIVIAFWQFRYTEFHPVRRAFSVGNKNDFSWRNRLAAWEGSLAMMADRPLTGFGWNQPERIYDQFYRSPKVSEGMAIQLNHYFTLGMSIGLPALLCFAAYIGLSLTRSAERGTRSGGETNRKSQIVNLEWVCRGGAVVLLVGLWFDGGLFNLATGAMFWVLLELGRGTMESKPNPEASTPKNTVMLLVVAALLVTGLLWANARDPFHREWLSVKTPNGDRFSAAAVMPKGAGPFPVVMFAHGSAGSIQTSGETLRQFAGLGMAAVGFEYSQTNAAEFNTQYAALLDESAKRHWARAGATAWVGHSLGAQRQLSFFLQNPSRQPALLVRLNGGMVEELNTSAQRGVRSAEVGGFAARPIEHPTSSIQQPASNGGRAGEVNELRGEGFEAAAADRQSEIGNRKLPQPTANPSQEESRQPATFNLQPATSLAVWIAHGENDEVFPASDARKVAEALRATGAKVEVDIFPGRGHGFGEDQSLLVRAASEFCARELGVSTSGMSNVRPAKWMWWAPLALIGFGLLARFVQRRKQNTAVSNRGLRITAGAVGLLAVLVSAAHFGLPLLRVNSATKKLAHFWCVRPAMREDFDWLVQQPGANGKRIGELLEHLELATVQRGQFAASLTENEWREFVLSPWIDGTNQDITWRRILWEWMAPRVRRESSVQEGALQVARQLRLRVLTDATPNMDQRRTIAECWSSGRVDGPEREVMAVAALRAAGIPARCDAKGEAAVLVDGKWINMPQTIVGD